MKHRLELAAVALGTLAVGGCAVTRENQGSCKASAAVVGALVGGGAGGAGVGIGTGDGAAGAGAGAGGALLGGFVGYLLGNHFCQVPEAPPPPPQPPPPPPPAKRKVELSADTYFDFDRSTLKPDGKRIVDEEVVAPMKEHRELRALVEGHTDSIGSESYNQRLSERRANAVRDYMVSRGVEASRITTKGWGKSKPVASNETKEGQAKNRRVEITEE